MFTGTTVTPAPEVCVGPRLTQVIRISLAINTIWQSLDTSLHCANSVSRCRSTSAPIASVKIMVTLLVFDSIHILATLKHCINIEIFETNLRVHLLISLTLLVRVKLFARTIFSLNKNKSCIVICNEDKKQTEQTTFKCHRKLAL